MRTGLLAVSAVLAALLASLCCIGPIVLAALGISGLGLTTAFAPYRLWLMGLALLLLVTGIYVTYRKRACCGADPARTGFRGGAKLAWWVVLVVAVASLALAPRMLAVRQTDGDRQPAAASVAVPDAGSAQDPCCPPAR
ncbi:MAG: mercury transporter MerT [Armatimonadetes bacterium]|nr:mercury transporter MerT [Armatimonadota bacterium]